MHASSFICACGVQYLHTELSELTHDACLGLSIAWACLPNAVADLANMKGSIMDVKTRARTVPSLGFTLTTLGTTAGGSD